MFCNKSVVTKRAQLASRSTQQLLQDLGFVHQPSSGTVNWLPNGFKVLKKMEQLVAGHMDSVGGQRVLLTGLSRAENWKRTGRWDNHELFKLGVNGREFCLAPTHEEEVTSLVAEYPLSKSMLPLLLYQVSTKYRLEKRPRGGILRGREFIMKDAYSFDETAEGALATFHKVSGAYHELFRALRVPFVRAQADSGEIGGELSQEWHLVHEVGEDRLLQCTGCGKASNYEVCESFPLEGAAQHSRAQAEYLLSTDGDFVAVYYPAGRELDYRKLSELVEIDDTSRGLDVQEVVRRFAPNEDDFVLKRVVRVMDLRVGSQSELPEFPLTQFQKNNFSLLHGNIVFGAAGEACECGAPLREVKAIEVGHCFYLGNRYSKPLGARAEGAQAGYEMGCYGIGVSRLVGAIAEINRDARGLRWPAAVAPFELSVVPAPSGRSADVDAVAQAVAQFDVRVDRRACNFSAKLQESNALGVPLVVIVGERYPVVEIEVRGVLGNRGELAQGEFEFERVQRDELSAHWDIQKDKHFVHVDVLPRVVQLLLREL